MKTYKEMADDALNRISQYEIKQQNNRKRIIRIAAPAVGCCLAAAVCFGMWQSSALKDRTKLAEPVGTNEKKYTPEEIEVQNQQEKQLEQQYEKQQAELENSDLENVKSENSKQIDKKSDEQIIISNNEDIKGPEASSMDFCIFWWKNKISMYGDLYWAINDNPDGTFAVTAKYRPTPEKVTDFTYEGKTLFRLAVEADNERMMPEKKETSAARTYKLAYNAYLETVLPETEKVLSENNIKCERAPYSTDSLNIVVTADELENLPLENMEFWVFALTNNDLKGSQPANDAADLTVTN